MLSCKSLLVERSENFGRSIPIQSNNYEPGMQM